MAHLREMDGGIRHAYIPLQMEVRASNLISSLLCINEVLVELLQSVTNYMIWHMVQCNSN